MDHPLAVPEKLDLDVPPGRQITLQVHPRIAEGRARLRHRPADRVAEVSRAVNPPHATATAAAHRFHQHRPADLPGQIQGLPAVADPATRQHGEPGAAGMRARRELVTDGLQLPGCRADEHDPRGGARPGEIGVLGKEAVAGVDRVGPRRCRRGEHRAGVEVALGGLRAAEADRRAGHPGRHRIQVGRGGREHRLDAEAVAGADDPRGDFTAIGDEDPAEDHAFSGSAAGPVSGSIRMSTASWPANSASCQADLHDRAAHPGDDRVHQLHRLDDPDHRVRADAAADLDEWRRARLRRAVEGARQGGTHLGQRGPRPRPVPSRPPGHTLGQRGPALRPVSRRQAGYALGRRAAFGEPALPGPALPGPALPGPAPSERAPPGFPPRGAGPLGAAAPRDPACPAAAAASVWGAAGDVTCGGDRTCAACVHSPLPSRRSERLKLLGAQVQLAVGQRVEELQDVPDVVASQIHGTAPFPGAVPVPPRYGGHSMVRRGPSMIGAATP